MSDTPETDELNGRLDYSLTDAYLLMTQHSKKMEQERNEWKQVAEGNLLGAIHERDDLRNELNDTIRSCYIWQNGHSKIVEDRDYWRAEAERWRAIAYGNRH